MIDLLVKFPTRERPDRFRLALSLLTIGCRHADRVHYLFSLDEDDPMLTANAKVIAASGIASERYTVVVGRSAGKIHAVNRDIATFSKEWRSVLVASDDMHATDAWDVWACSAMREFHPDGDGMVWFFDGHQQDICTIPLLGRAYYDRHGYIYNPIYRSVFADDEQTHQAKALGRLTVLEHVIMRHDHPAWNSGLKPDDLYRRNETKAIWDADHATYKDRLAAGFP